MSAKKRDRANANQTKRCISPKRGLGLGLAPATVIVLEFGFCATGCFLPKNMRSPFWAVLGDLNFLIYVDRRDKKRIFSINKYNLVTFLVNQLA